LIITAVLLIVGLGWWVWWRYRQAPFKVAAIIPGPIVAELSNVGIITFSIEGTVYWHDWDGRRRDQFQLPDMDVHITPSASGWRLEGEGWYQQGWTAADAIVYTPKSMPERNIRLMRYLVRFSPDGRYLGAIDYLPHRLEISVRKVGQSCWQRTMPITPAGPITGRKFIDLLVTNEGQVILYTPLPAPKPLAAVSPRQVRTAGLTPRFHSLTLQYQRALVHSPMSRPTGWQLSQFVRARSLDDRYCLSFDPVYLPFKDLLPERFPHFWPNRYRLILRERPGVVRTAIPVVSSMDGNTRITFQLPYKGQQWFIATSWGEDGYFSPDGSRCALFDENSENLCIYRLRYRGRRQ